MFASGPRQDDPIIFAIPVPTPTILEEFIWFVVLSIRTALGFDCRERVEAQDAGRFYAARAGRLGSHELSTIQSTTACARFVLDLAISLIASTHSLRLEFNKAAVCQCRKEFLKAHRHVAKLCGTA